MAVLIHEHSIRVRSEEGTLYSARILGEERADGTWYGWIEFVPADAAQATLRTGEETSQPNRGAVDYWASGIEPVFLAGALSRAQGRLPAGLASARVVRGTS